MARKSRRKNEFSARIKQVIFARSAGAKKYPFTCPYFSDKKPIDLRYIMNLIINNFSNSLLLITFDRNLLFPVFR